MTINRFFTESTFDRIKKDFNFLINYILSSYGEYDFAIRKDYFNIYYRGNSLAKVVPQSHERYQIIINSKFFDGTKADRSGLYVSKKGSGNISIICFKSNLKPFFQKKHMSEFAARIKRVNYGEEIGFEQSLITDNLYREDLIFIDRQVTDISLKRQRMDLLALKQVNGNKYQFLVCEVKMGNNPQLQGDVAQQLRVYIDHIELHFKEYKECYEKQYKQKKGLGLIETAPFDNIEIVKEVKGVNGLIIVGGYSVQAKAQIDVLKKSHPNISVIPFSYVI